MLSSHGPIESARWGMGRRRLVQSLTASERTSIQLFTTQASGTSGHAIDQSAIYPNYH